MENLNEKIKLPSSWMLVNPDSIWRYLQAISRSGSVFNKEQLIKAGLYTSSEDNISRNLSYLKYLGIIEEERGRGKNQRFKVIDQLQIRDILYELKANRENEAVQKFKDYLKGHLLFQTLKDEFFKHVRSKTFTELEHFLKDGIPGKTPQFYQKGGQFLMKLLSFASLATISGNDIELDGLNDEDEVAQADVGSENAIDASFQKTDQNDHFPALNQKYEDAELVVSDKYVVQFIGPGMNARYEIREEDDLIIVDATLTKIKKKLK